MSENTINDVCRLLEEWAPLHYQESYDNCGLLTGNRPTLVKGVLITLDCVEDIVDEAITLGCNMIVAHHPILFSGLKSLTGRNYIERTVIKAIKNDIAIYAIHTNLDNLVNGVNHKIAGKIGLKNTSILVPKHDKVMLKKLVVYCPAEASEKVKQALFDAGGGKIGNYDECSFNIVAEGTFRPLEGSNPYSGTANKRELAREERIELVYQPSLEHKIIEALKQSHPYEEIAYQVLSTDNAIPGVGAGIIGELEHPLQEGVFLTGLKEKMGVSCVKYTHLKGEQVKKVAVCGGSGSFLLKDAIKQGADVFVSSDFKYHQFFDAEGKIVIADIGHFESEQFTKELIFEYFTKKSVNFAVHLSKINTNPVNYL